MRLWEPLFRFGIRRRCLAAETIYCGPGGGIFHGSLVYELGLIREGRFSKGSPIGQKRCGASLIEKLHVECGRFRTPGDGFAFASKQVCGINNKNNVESIVWNAARMMVMSDGFHDRGREAPHAEQVGSHFGVRNLDKTLLNLIERHVLLFGLVASAREVCRYPFSHHQFADVV